jgi:hypothetical protein
LCRLVAQIGAAASPHHDFAVIIARPHFSFRPRQFAAVRAVIRA